jgi:hypothetical protein
MATIKWKDNSCALDAVLLLSTAAQMAVPNAFDNSILSMPDEFQGLRVSVKHWTETGLWHTWNTDDLSNARNSIRENLRTRISPIWITGNTAIDQLTPIFFPAQLTYIQVELSYQCGKCENISVTNEDIQIQFPASLGKNSTIKDVLNEMVSRTLSVS